MRRRQYSVRKIWAARGPRISVLSSSYLAHRPAPASRGILPDYCRPLHLLPCGLLPFRASSFAAMASRRSRLQAAMRQGLPPLTCRGSRLRGAGRGTTQRSMASGEAAPCASSGLGSRLLMPERTRGRRIAFGDSTKPVHRPTKFLLGPLFRRLLHLCCTKRGVLQPFVVFQPSLHRLQLSHRVGSPQLSTPHKPAPPCRPPSARSRSSTSTGP